MEGLAMGADEKRTRFRRFDIAEKLETEDDIQRYMKGIMAECADDPSVVAIALGHVARARNLAQLAREVGVTREGLHRSLSPGGNPSFATVAKVAKALGFKLTISPA